MTLRALLLAGLCAFTMTHVHAQQEKNAIKTTNTTILANSNASHRPSGYLAKELDKQKQNMDNMNTDISDIKLLTTIRVQPTQSFFAYQHESFSRFLQAIFSPNS